MLKQLVFASLVFAAACGGGNKSKPAPVTPTSDVATPAETPAVPEAKEEKKEEPPPPPAPKTATAKLAAASKSKVSGTVTFKEVEGGLEVTANIEGLTPGEHAWHVHEKGDCSAPDAKSAGGHFNPENHKHGAPDAEEHHAGDFGNLTAGKDGKATNTFTMKGITLDEGATSVIGKGFIVHAKKDDFKTQPTGNAGDRVACGVIELDK
jgi:Cu-Zn family superoxide dismutase